MNEDMLNIILAVQRFRDFMIIDASIRRNAGQEIPSWFQAVDDYYSRIPDPVMKRAGLHKNRVDLEAALRFEVTPEMTCTEFKGLDRFPFPADARGQYGVTVISTPERVEAFAKPDQDIFGNAIKVGSKVRSFNLATLLNDGRIYGMDTALRSDNRVDYIEGEILAIGEVSHEGCPRYTIRVTRECYGADGVDTSDVRYGEGHLVYPPVNGTPKSPSGGVTFGVVVIE